MKLHDAMQLFPGVHAYVDNGELLLLMVEEDGERTWRGYTFEAKGNQIAFGLIDGELGGHFDPNGCPFTIELGQRTLCLKPVDGIGDLHVWLTLSTEGDLARQRGRLTLPKGVFLNEEFLQRQGIHPPE